MTTARALALVALAAVPAWAAPSRVLRWEQVFTADGGPAVHARARYRDARGGEHQLELWRSARAVRRDTDGKLTVVASRRPGADDQYRVIDRERGRVFDAAQGSLQHAGMLVDWSQLTSLLTRPRADVVVAPMARAPERIAAGECRWYEVGGDKPTHRVCWSAKLKLPLVVEQAAPAGWTTVVTVESARVSSIPATIFAPSEDGLARVDLDADVD